MVNSKVVNAWKRDTNGHRRTPRISQSRIQFALFLLALTSKVLDFERSHLKHYLSLSSDPGTAPHHPKADCPELGPRVCQGAMNITMAAWDVSSHKTSKFICLIEQPRDQEALIRVVHYDRRVSTPFVSKSFALPCRVGRLLIVAKQPEGIIRSSELYLKFLLTTSASTVSSPKIQTQIEEKSKNVEVCHNSLQEITMDSWLLE